MFIYLFCNLFSILITNALNSLSGKLCISVSLSIFQGFSLALSFETISSVSFCLTFPVSMNLVKQLPIVVLKGSLYVGASLYPSCSPVPLVGELDLT